MTREIIHKEHSRRFETEEDGFTGYVEYKLDGAEIDFIHTIVPKEIGGRGIAAEIVAFALDYANERGLKVRPTCPYVKFYLEQHPIQRRAGRVHGDAYCVPKKKG